MTMNELIEVEDKRYKEYEKLIIRKDHIKADADSAHVEYIKVFGDLINENYECKIECIKAKKLIALLVARINAGALVDEKEIKNIVDDEMSSYYKDLQDMIDGTKSAKDSKEVPLAQVLDAKRIYKEIAKLIHPDIHPSFKDDFMIKKFWESTQIAYSKWDSIALEEIKVSVQKYLRDKGASIEVEIVDDIELKIDRIKKEIESIMSTEPYLYRELLRSQDRVAQRKESIKQDTKETEEYLSELQKEYEDMLHDYNSKQPLS